jgi:acyl-CoA reductase-like NAD-dependent aldehyde dehydrogenase
VRDTGEAAIRVDGSHCTKSVTAAGTYDTDDEADAIANNSIYGLSGEVSSADTERTLRVAQRMRTGSVTVNGSTFFGIAR